MVKVKVEVKVGVMVRVMLKEIPERRDLTTR